MHGVTMKKKNNDVLTQLLLIDVEVSHMGQVKGLEI